MDDEPAGGEGDATVTLTADIQPWEAALDQAAAKVSEWAATAAARFAAAGKDISDQAAKAAASIQGLFDAGQGDLAAGIGKTVGDKIGSKIGAVLGTSLGPVGTLVGDKLGGLIGEQLAGAISRNVDADAIGQGLLGVLAEVQKTVSDVGGTWESVRRDAADAFAGIKTALGEMGVADVLAGDFDAVSAKVTEFVGQASARVSDLIDRTVERFKPALASVANGVQQVFEYFGLAEAGTLKWGDALKDVEGVGVRVMQHLAYAIGTIEDVVNLVAGSIRVSMFSSFKGLGELLAKIISEFLQFASQFDAFGVQEALGIDLKAIGEQAADIGKIFGEGMGEAITDAEKQMDRALRFERGQQRFDNMGRNITAGQEKNAEVDTVREAADAAAAGFAAAIDLMANRVKVPEFAGAGVMKTVEATVAGGREAAQLAARDAGRGGPGDAMKQVADASRENLAVHRQVRDEVAKLNRNFEKMQPLRTA